MLSMLEASGRAAGMVAAERARERIAAALAAAVPEASVTIEGEAIVLRGPIAADDARLRWIGSLLA
ncbi:hypothetical protein U1872_10315 [Sphingomonas sp. RB3P16]|uniref:hypothetical protein n=1 Tax=Parasphingomonas frigoris TaxID=3096163 RepID=UPI002FC868E4